jgi:hypothetical protein
MVAIYANENEWFLQYIYFLNIAKLEETKEKNI